MKIRKFKSGADRDIDDGKLDYEGFLSPLVLLEYAKYMHRHRVRKDGTRRESDNWGKGIPQKEYIKSLLRHTMDLWLHHRGFDKMAREDKVAALCGIMFNSMGYLHEELK